jgi:hypothetical protein
VVAATSVTAGAAASSSAAAAAGQVDHRARLGAAQQVCGVTVLLDVACKDGVLLKCPGDMQETRAERGAHCGPLRN